MFRDMVTFNELLCAHRIDPARVALLRHTGRKGPVGVTPHDLWLRQDDSFMCYQNTQAPGQRRFDLPYWASFVASPANDTLFVGLYAAIKGDPSEIKWLDPMTGLLPARRRRRRCRPVPGRVLTIGA